MSEDNVVPFKVVEKVPQKTPKEAIVSSLRDCLSRIEAIPDDKFDIEAVFVAEQIMYEGKGVFYNTWFEGRDLNRLEIMGVMSHLSNNSNSQFYWMRGQHEPLV